MRIGSRVKNTTSGHVGTIIDRCAGFWVVLFDGGREGLMMPASHLVEELERDGT